jgi:tRNA U34 5-methylaminomethyl-2-thiouridine-forming methyltransferase MnmC
MQDQDQSGLTWRDGVIPVSNRFDDPYFSLNDGLAETRHVFLQGNDLPARLVPDFHIAELGFGTGLNMLAVAMIAQVPVRFTSFEAYPLTADEIARALEHFPQARAVADPFLAAWDAGVRQFTVGQISTEIIIGDARETLPQWEGKADAWFLDGFSPAKNPQLWNEDLMAHVGQHTAINGTFATYTAAGFVRRGLAAGGFTVERVAGHGTKRHMSRGVMQHG